MKANISTISETILALERGINERWNKGDVDGALEMYSEDVTYFDPLTEMRLEGRKAVEFEPTDSASQKLLYIYRLLVHDKVIQPLPEDQVAEASMRHKLAIWYSKQLPKDHPLLK